MWKRFALGAALSTLTAAFAQSKTTPARTPESLECSKQADAKGLHGSERRHFRRTCIRDMRKKG